jgi:mono/diheme cytochrome c family protein
MARISAAVMAIMALLAAAGVAAQLPGDVAAGRKLAEGVCAECHKVTASPTLPPLGRAPSFTDIARNPETSELGLRAFLQTPHARMPNLALSSRDTDDVISYILSVKQR